MRHLLVTDDGTHRRRLRPRRDRDRRIDRRDPRQRRVRRAIADLATGGTGPVLGRSRPPSRIRLAVGDVLADLIGGDALDYESRITAADARHATVLFGSPGSGETRTAVDEAIADGRCPGSRSSSVPRVAVATSEGVSFIDPAHGRHVERRSPLEGGAHGLALVTGIDDPRLYVTSGTAEDPTYHVIAVGGDDAADGPVDRGDDPLPGLGSLRRLRRRDPAGPRPGSARRRRGQPRWRRGPSTSSSRTRNAVYADARAARRDRAGGVGDGRRARVPGRRSPAAAGVRRRRDDRRRSTSARTPSPGACPGVIAGVADGRLPVPAGADPVPAAVRRGLGRPRSSLLDGMLFVQSRIGMNDVYVGLFIVAAYTVFAAVWTGWWRGRGGVLARRCRSSACCSASRWPRSGSRPMPSARWCCCSSCAARSGGSIAILGLIAITSVLGYLAIRAGRAGLGNLPFLVIMIALTLIAVVVAVFHPIAWTDEEMWLALVAPAAAGAASVLRCARARPARHEPIVIGPLSVTPLLAAIACVAAARVVVYGAFRLGGRLGYGPLAAPPPPGDPARLLDRRRIRPRPAGCDRAGCSACRSSGRRSAWSPSRSPSTSSRTSRGPLIENHRLWDGFPAGHTGQTLRRADRARCTTTTTA